jgi:DNA-binding Xre family transcriptional regulator
MNQRPVVLNKTIALVAYKQLITSGSSPAQGYKRGKIEYSSRLRSKRLKYLSPAESQQWLKFHLAKTEIKSLTKLAEITGIHKGNLSKYFWHIQRPTIDVVAVLCTALKVTPSEVLFGLGAIEGSDYSFLDTSTP